MVPSLCREQVLILPAEIAILSNSGGGSVVEVVGSTVVRVGGWAADTSGEGVAGGAVVLSAAVVAMVSGSDVGCVLSLLVAQAVAARAAMARTDRFSRSLLKFARAVVMTSNDNPLRAKSQVRAGLA